MASRKDFASKKKPARRKPATNSQKPQQPVKAKAAPAPAPVRQAKKPWKLLIASVVALGIISTVLYQLTQVDPKQIRETGISALIEEKLSQGNDTQTSTSIDDAAPAKPVVTKPPVVQKSAQKPPEKTKEKPVVKVPVSDKSSQSTPKEPYQFYKILAEDTVETENIEAYKSTPKTANLKNKTLLQTGSFRNAKDAERMKVRLILNNLPKVKVSKTTSANGTWYRVRTGPFITFKQLKTALIKLNKLSISPIQIPVK